MTDYHCHILPGLDDGPSTLDESIQMARLLSEAGFTSVYCTPHLIRNVYDASNTAVRLSIKALQNALDRQGIALRLLEGREYCMDNHFLEYLSDLMPLEETGYLLVEIPPDSYQGMVLEAIAAITRKGLTPMIAHPERCRILTGHKNHKIPKSLGFFGRNSIRGRFALEYSYQHIELLDWLLSVECGFQCNISSFSGSYGRQIQDEAANLWQQGIYTHIGTDAHSSEFLAQFNRQISNKKSITAACMQNIHNSARIKKALV
jgi:protein-tyrosine phosphatase